MGNVKKIMNDTTEDKEYQYGINVFLGEYLFVEDEEDNIMDER